MVRGSQANEIGIERKCDALEKQLKNSKHEDGKLENFICFESKVKSSHSTQLSSGEDFVDVGDIMGDMLME